MKQVEHVIDLLPAYALDSLDREETLRVAEHLLACETCRKELQAFQYVVEILPLAVPQVTPPSTVKAGLMARVQAAQSPSKLETEFAMNMVPQDGVPYAAKDTARSAEQSALQKAPQKAQQTSWTQQLRRVFHGLSPAWGVASLALVLVLMTSNILLWQQVNRLNSSKAGTLPVVNLVHTDAAPQAHGLLVMSADGVHGTLVVDKLPVLGEDQQYQLWLIQDGKRTSGGVFSVDEYGYGSKWVQSPQPLADYQSFGITIEPAGGSPGPTGAKVLGGSL